jgi:phytoene/squalene synthetase
VSEDVIDALRDLVRAQADLAEHNLSEVRKRQKKLEHDNGGPCDG